MQRQTLNNINGSEIKYTSHIQLEDYVLPLEPRTRANSTANNRILTKNNNRKLIFQKLGKRQWFFVGGGGGYSVVFCGTGMREFCFGYSYGGNGQVHFTLILIFAASPFYHRVANSFK